MKKSLISMLVLLMTVATGAWAQEGTLLTTIESTGNADFKSGSKTFDNCATVTFSGNVYNDGDHWGWFSQVERTLTVTAAEGYTITRVKFCTLVNSAFDEVAPFEAILVWDNDISGSIAKVNGTSIGQMGVTKIEVYGYANTPEPTTYKVSVKGGTEDATTWRGKAGTGEYQALPLWRVAAGTAVSVKYNGTKKVKIVKAVKKAAAAAAPALNLTSPAVGQVIGDNGRNYDYASLPSGVTAVAKICYVSGSNGLALALTDEGNMNWSTAISTCAAHTPAFTGGTWKLATQDEWDYMMGTDGAGSYTALRDGFSSVGGSNLQSRIYWSSTEYDSSDARWYDFEYGGWGWAVRGAVYVSVRACLAFGAQGSDPDPIELTSNDGETWTLDSMPEYDVELEVTYYTDAELVDEVIAKITAIGTVTYTPESKALIDAARTAYDALTAAQRALVTNYSTLTDAETTYAAAEEVAFTEGVELTPTGTKNEWALAATPAFDVELEVEYETALALSETTDNSAALTEWNGYEADVTLTRTLQAGSYNTFAAPFSTAIPSGWTVKELTSATFADGTLTLNFATAASIEAGKPYLVKVSANADLSAAPFTGAIVSKNAQPFTSTDVDFIPTLGATTIPDGDTKAVLFMTSGNTLKSPSALPANIKGFRAYFQLKGETASLACAFSIDFGDGETTGIMAIGTDRAASTDNATYTLDGRRISKATQKGVYIQNGKKVIIK